jgi:ligand-binding sensor domain-containing protein/signal transduction histidine kinase
MVASTRMWILLALILGTGTVCPPMSAQAHVPVGPDYVRTDFTIDQGLPDNTINAITQTDNGLLWVATGSGLASFDGHSFAPVQIRMPGVAQLGSVKALVTGVNGDLWVGSDAGIARIAKADLNDPYLTSSSGYRIGKQQSDDIAALFCAKDGTIWAGTNHGLYYFDGRGFRQALGAYVSRIHQAIDGKLMLLTHDGFIEYDGKHIFKHPELGQRFGIKNDEIFDVVQAADGTIWYCTSKGTIPVGIRDAYQLIPSIAARAKTFRGYVGPDGTLWFSTNLGLFQLNGNTLHSPAQGLGSRAAFIGHDGDIWIGTNGNGLSHLQPSLVRTYTQADGLESNVSMAVLSAHDGRIWVGSNCGLAVYDHNHFHSYSEKDGLANTCVWSMAEDHEHNIWIGTYGGGLFRFHDGVFTQFTISQGLVNNVVLNVTVAHDDTVWAGTLDGLSHFDKAHIRNYTTADGLPGNHIFHVHEDRAGNIWVATQSGVARYAKGHFDVIAADFESRDVMARRFIEDSLGHLYTTDAPSGLSRIQDNHISLINRSLNLFDMAETTDHNLWFSSRNGIVRITEGELESIGASSRQINFLQINRSQGMISTEASSGSPDIVRDDDGRVWLGTVKGIVVIDPTRISAIGRKPNIFVADVTVDGLRDRVGNSLWVAPGPHRVELHVDAVDLATPENSRLQYRMEGVDLNWLDLDASRTAVYTSLPPGKHQLMVRATDSLGTWDAGFPLYEVTERPYFYQTRAFQIGTAVGVLFLLAAAYLLRVRYLLQQTQTILEQRQIERESMARDLHDTFLQGMQGLVLRIHAGTRRLPADEPARQLFEQALVKFDGVMLEGRTVLSRLRSRNVHSEDLAASFIALSEDLGFLSTAEFRVSVGGRKLDLSRVVQEELYAIGREALFNAFRHSQAKCVGVEMQFGRFELRLSFKDDGKGLDSSILHDGGVPGHYGLPGIRERVSRIGGNMALRSSSQTGTEIEVRVPASIAYLKTGKGYLALCKQRIKRLRRFLDPRI